MRANRYFRILVVLGIAAVMCWAVHAAGAGVIAETNETSGIEAPVCSAPCECMGEDAAAAYWGVSGYEKCSKTVCGQSSDAKVQYYCFHPMVSEGAAAPAAPAAAGVTQKSPVSAVTVFAAIGAALLTVAVVKRD